MEHKLREYLNDDKNDWTPEAKGTIKKENRFVLNLKENISGGSDGRRISQVSVYFQYGKHLVVSVNGYALPLNKDMTVSAFKTIIKNLA